jgi:hypothetical protein
MTQLTYFDSLKNIYSSILLLACMQTSLHIQDYFWEVLSSPKAHIYSDIGFLGFPPSPRKRHDSYLKYASTPSPMPFEFIKCDHLSRPSTLKEPL